jgi:hypothetical protein
LAIVPQPIMATIMRDLSSMHYFAHYSMENMEGKAMEGMMGEERSRTETQRKQRRRDKPASTQRKEYELV